MHRLQKKAEEAWNDLLLIYPTHKENTYSMIEFFLGQIQDSSEDELINEQCRWKILELTRSLVEHPSGHDRSAGGRI